MKSLTRSILLSSTLVAIAAGALVSLNLSSGSITKVNASGAKELYVQVTDAGDLKVGDTAIIACGDRAIGGLGGNPCYTFARQVDGGNNDKTKFYFDSTEAIKFEVGTGYTGLGSFSFKSTKTAAEETDYWLKTSNRYLSYIDPIEIDGHWYGYHYDDITIQTKGDIIFRKDLDEFSSWNLDIDSEGYAYLSRYNEENRYGTEGHDDPITINYDRPSSTYELFGYYTGGSNIRIFRKVDLSEVKDTYAYIYKSGNKSHYEPNETAVLTGLEMDVTLYFKDNTTATYNVKYSNETSYFTLGTASYADQEVSFSWLGFEFSYSAEVKATLHDEHYYNDVSDHSKPKDIRGTYLLGANHEDITYLLNLSTIGQNVYQSGIPSVVSLGSEMTSICDKDDEYGQDIANVVNNVFEIVYHVDGYYIKIGNKYLCRENPNNYNYYYLYLDTIENAFKVEQGNDGHLVTPDNDIFVYFFQPGAVGVYLNRNGSVSSNEEAMVLFKKEFSSDESIELETYRSSFFSNTNVCRNDGTTVLATLVSNWSTLASSFTNLSTDSQGYLACLTYIHNDEVALSLNDLVDRYDYIVSKYSGDGCTDFMNRSAANTLQNNVQSINNITLDNNMGVNVTVILTIVSMSLLSISGFIVMRKRRHN